MVDKRVSPEVEAYLANVTEPFRGMLERIRTVVREEAPEAQEVIAYGIPTFKLAGNLVHYAAFTSHCSFFPGRAIEDASLKSELAGFRISKGTIQYTPDNPLPDDVVRKIVRVRIAENRAKAAARPGKKG